MYMFLNDLKVIVKLRLLNVSHILNLCCMCTRGIYWVHVIESNHHILSQGVGV